METVREDRVLADDSGEVKRDVIPVTDDVITESENERLSSSANFPRGTLRTMSMDRSHKPPQRAASPSVLSISSGKPAGLKRFFSLFGSKSEKDQAKYENAQFEFQQSSLRKENETLKEQIQGYKEQIQGYKEEILNLQTKIVSQEDQQTRFLSTVNQMLETYDRKFASLDDDTLQIFRPLKEVHKNIQIATAPGSTNIQNISTVDTTGLNELLLQYHNNLEYVKRQWNQARESLDRAENIQEQLLKQIADLRKVQKEVIDAVLEIKESKKELSTELDYTVSWTDPTLMVECVKMLRNLPKRTENYIFKDLEGKAQVGVLRIYRKYGKRMTFKRFVQQLEMEEILGSEELTNDRCLEKNDCASLLVTWVHRHEENDADALLELFPRIKAGALSRQHGKVPYYDPGSMDSLLSHDDLSLRTEHLKEWFGQEMRNLKDNFQSEIVILLKTKLEELKMAMIDKSREPKFV